MNAELRTPTEECGTSPLPRDYSNTTTTTTNVTTTTTDYCLLGHTTHAIGTVSTPRIACHIVILHACGCWWSGDAVIRIL